MAKKRISKVRQQIEKEWPSALAFGTILPDYNITEDPTFTRERTGAGSIEYFNEPFINYGTEENPNIILNPNGYEPTLLYNPDTNTVDDVKLDLLHHYRQYDPAYLDLLLNYEQSLLPKKDDILWNSLLGDVFREKYNYDAAQWSKHMDEWENIVNSTPWESEYILLGVDGSLRNLLASDETIRTSNYAPREDAQRQWLSTPESKLAFDNILTYLTGYRLPEVEKVANKRAEGGALRPEWNSLSMRERAAYIRDAVSRGLNTVTDIRNDYNEFKGGGKKKTNNGSILTFLNLLNESLKGNSRYNTTGWRKYLTDLAKMESSYRGDVTNSIGAKGYFLLMPSNRSASWSTPTQLFHEMYKLSDANMDYFRKNMTERDLKLAEQMGIDIYGLMAGAHLGGPKNALAALRGGRNAKDKNGTSVLNYMTRFSQTTPKQPISGDFKTVYFQPPIEETPEIEAPNPYVGYKLISLEDIDNLPLPSRIGDDEIAFEGTAPETIITPEPQKLYVQYTPKEIFDQMSSMITPYEPVELPKPLTATERLKELSDNRVSLLLKDLEDSIIRSYRLNDFDKEKLRRDVEDLLFYRNMAAYGGNLFSGEDAPTQQMNNGLNLYRRTNNLGETEYIYQETPDSEEILLTPTNKRFSDDPTNWDYKDASGREYSPRMAKPAVAQAELRPYEKDWYHKMTEALGYDWLVNKSNEYYNNPILGAAARWAASYNNNTNPIKGLWNSSLAYANIYPMAAKAADELLLNPNGLQKTIDLYNNSDGSYADRYAWQNSLLGDVFNTSMILPAASKGYQSIKKAAEVAYNELPWTYKIPENPSMAYRRMGPLERDWLMEGNELSIRKTNALTEAEEEAARAASKKGRRFSLFKAGAEHGGRKQFAKGQPWKGTTVTHGEEQVLAIPGKDLPWVSGRHFHGPQGNGFGVGDISFEEAPFGSHIDLLTEEGYTGVNPSLLDGSVIYSPYKILGRNFGYKKLYPKITTPQITAENAASLAPEQLTILGSTLESPYKDDNGFNLLVKHLYNKKIHGYPAYTTDAMQFDPVAGEFTPVKREWADDVVTGLPKYAHDAIMHDVVDRNIAEFMSEGLPLEEATKYADAARKQLSSVRSGTYSQGDYNKAGWGDFGGFYDPKRNFISVNEADNPKRVYTHEGRHLLDHKIDDEILFPGESTTFGTDFDSDVSKAIMQRTRLNQEMILRDAYDSDFESIPSSKYAEGLEDYNSINREAITTNLDSRTYAYDNFADINSLNSGTRIEELPTEAQNSFIDGLTDELVFEAIEHANGYGRRYINRLRDEGKLTSKKAQQFREAMKHVGVAAFPVAAGAGLLFGLNNL